MAILCLASLAGCGDDPPENENSLGGSADSIACDDTGNSNVLLACTDAARQISSDRVQFGVVSQIELGMYAAQVRVIFGKPRRIIEGVWTFGYGLPVQGVVDEPWDWVPTVTVPVIGTTAFSGDNTLCDGTESLFIDDAQVLIVDTVLEDHVSEVPDCQVAARRIAAKVELGMTARQVRTLVGKPVKISDTGLWQYMFAAPSDDIYVAPVVQFGKASLIGTTDPFSDPFSGDNEATGTDRLLVVGYWSPENTCLL